MRSLFHELDGTRLNLAHLKVMIVSGLGFFTDAYDLFVIGVVILILSGSAQTSIHLTGNQIGAIGSSSLASAILGQLLFGRIADIYGRKKIYGVELAILIAGAVMSSLSWSFESLLISRIILGIGIGGDYPVSATIMSEYSNARDRGKLVGLVFSMQGIGAITAVLAAYTLTAFFSPEVAWRLLLGLGALPPMSVVFLRRRIPETPRYSLLVAGNHEEAVRGLRMVIGGSDGDFTRRKVKIEYSINRFSDFLKRFWEPLFIASSTWFLMDVAFYGTGIYSGFIVSGLIQRGSLQSQILMAGIPYFVGGFGYFFAAFLMDSMGRKRIQIQGFLAMAAIYSAVALSIVAEGSRVKELALPRELAFLIYSLSFFFINFGPNETTFILPTELFPTKFRSTANGIASASGKAGAAVSTYIMPMLLNSIGIRGVLFLLSGISLLGALISMRLKETAGLVLEEASKEKELLKIAT